MNAQQHRDKHGGIYPPNAEPSTRDAACWALIAATRTSGRWFIDTEHSTYHLDADARTIKRTPIHDDATPRDDDETALPFRALACHPSGVLGIVWPDGRQRVTTRVLGVTRDTDPTPAVVTIPAQVVAA